MKTPAELSAEEASFRAYIERLPKPAAPQRSQALAKRIAQKLRGKP